MYDLILRDATIVSSTGRLVADIAIRDGQIVYVGPRPRRKAHREISAIGKFIMPGVIDTAFGASSDPRIWEQESRAAVSGGITTVVGLPDGDKPVVDSASAQARAKRIGKHSWANFGLWMQGADASEQVINDAVKNGDVVGSLLDLADGNEDGLAKRLTDLKNAGGVLAVRTQRSARDADGVTTVLSAARDSERAIHVMGLSTADELSALDPVLGEVPLSLGTTPHHLFLSTDGDEAAPIPPLRPEQDRRTLWTAIRRSRFTCVASDHHVASKDGPGVPGAEYLFPMLLSAVRHGRLSLEQLVTITSEGPAKLLGLESKGRIEKGADADLVIFSEGELARVREKSLVSGAGWSPYVGRDAAPKPELVIVNGEIVSSKGTIASEKPNGVRIQRGEPVAK